MKFSIPEIAESDIECANYHLMLPAINNAFRNYTINRIYRELQVSPSRVEPKLKTLARGGNVRRANSPLWNAVDLELKRASSQINSDDSHAIAARAAQNVRVRIEYNKKHQGKEVHKGNRDLTRLIGSLNSIWMEQTDRWPGVSNNADQLSSEYFDFIRQMTSVYIDKIPADLEQVAPKLKGELRKIVKSPDALHARFRKTGVSKLRRILKN